MDKQSLRDYQILLQEIDTLEEERQRIRDGFLGATSFSAMPRGRGNQDKLGNNVARLIDLGEVIGKRLDELIELRQQIEQAVAGVTATSRYLLRLRYLEGLSWEDLSEKIGYERSHLYRLHKQALTELEQPEAAKE